MKKVLFLSLLAALFASPAYGALAVSSCTASQDSATATLELTASTHNDGDLLIAVAIMNDDLTIVLNETGWTTINVTDDAAGGDKSVGAWYKIASSESGTYTIEDDGITSHTYVGWMCTITGFDSGTVLDQTTVTNTGTTNSDTQDPAAITTQTANAFVFTVAGGVQAGGGPLTQPSGHTEDREGHRGAVSLGLSHIDAGAAGSEDPGTWSGFSSTADTMSITFAIRPAPPPDFTSDPALDTCTATGCTFDYTADASGDTVYGMFLDTAASAPTCDAIESTTGSHGAANESTTGSADSLTLTSTDTPEFPLYNAYFCIEDSGGLDSDVITVSNNALADPSGEQHVAITSIGTGSPCASFNTSEDPDIANGDYLLASTTTSPSAYSLTIGADCQFSYTGDESRQSVLNVYVYDASVGNWHASDIDAWFNNADPVCDEEQVIAFDIDEAITNIIVANAVGSLCDDADGDTLTITLTSGTLPTGLSQGGTGNGTISGTPTVENESGASLTFTATDVASATDTQDMILYPIDTVTVPTITDSDIDAGIADELASFPWRSDPTLTVSFECSTQEAADQILTQNPAAAAEVAHDATLTAVASAGITCSRRRTESTP